jgi:hypothetical protein
MAPKKRSSSDSEIPTLTDDVINEIVRRLQAVFSEQLQAKFDAHSDKMEEQMVNLVNESKADLKKAVGKLGDHVDSRCDSLEMQMPVTDRQKRIQECRKELADLEGE